MRSFILGFALFSKIPMPRVEWTKSNMRYMLCALPLVGTLIGLFLWGWLWLCDALTFGPILFASGLTLIPVAVTGGIHLDGFSDTVDALASHALPEKKREILNDPHTGAFAVIFVCIYLLAYFALCTEIPREAHSMWFIGLVHMMTRAAIGFGVLHFRPAGDQGLFHSLGSCANKTISTIALCGVFVLCAAALTIIGAAAGLFSAMIPIICGIYVYFMSKKQFGGMSGDLSGYWLQFSELITLLAWILFKKAVIL